MLGFQGGVSIPLVKGGVKAPPAKRQCRAGPKAGARRGFTYEEGFLGTVFSQVVMTGQRLKNDALAETNYVWPAPWFLSNYLRGYTRRIDLDFHKRLRKPIAKALYPLLETGWYASDGKPYKKSYTALCEEFLLTNHR